MGSPILKPAVFRAAAVPKWQQLDPEATGILPAEPLGEGSICSLMLRWLQLAGAAMGLLNSVRIWMGTESRRSVSGQLAWQGVPDLAVEPATIFTHPLWIGFLDRTEHLILVLRSSQPSNSLPYNSICLACSFRRGMAHLSSLHFNMRNYPPVESKDRILHIQHAAQQINWMWAQWKDPGERRRALAKTGTHTHRRPLKDHSQVSPSKWQAHTVNNCRLPWILTAGLCVKWFVFLKKSMGENRRSNCFIAQIGGGTHSEKLRQVRRQSGAKLISGVRSSIIMKLTHAFGPKEGRKASVWLVIY